MKLKRNEILSTARGRGFS